MTIIPSSSSILWVYLEKRVCKRLKKRVIQQIRFKCRPLSEKCSLTTAERGVIL